MRASKSFFFFELRSKSFWVPIPDSSLLVSIPRQQTLFPDAHKRNYHNLPERFKMVLLHTVFSSVTAVTFDGANQSHPFLLSKSNGARYGKFKKLRFLTSNVILHDHNVVTLHPPQYIASPIARTPSLSLSLSIE